MHGCFGLHLYLCNMCLPGIYGGQKRASNPMDQMIVFHYVDSENQTLVIPLLNHGAKERKHHRSQDWERNWTVLPKSRANREFSYWQTALAAHSFQLYQEKGIYKALESKKAQSPFLPHPHTTECQRATVALWSWAPLPSTPANRLLVPTQDTGSR